MPPPAEAATSLAAPGPWGARWLRLRQALAPAGALGTLGLCLALISACVWTVGAAGWIGGPGAAVVVGIAAVLEAALLSRAADRIVGALMAPVLGVAVILLITAGGMPDDGVPGLRHAAQRYAVAFITGLWYTDDWDFLVGLCGVVWLAGYWLGWVAVRERRAVLAVLPVFIILAPNSINAPNPRGVAFPEAVTITLALLVAARVHYRQLVEAWRWRRVLPLPGLRERFGRGTVVAVTGILLTALTLPGLTTTDISGRLFHFDPTHRGSGGDAGSSPAPGDHQPTVGFSEVDRPGGRLVSDPKPVLSYELPDGGTSYLVLSVADAFTAGDWAPGVENSVPAHAGPINRDRSPAGELGDPAQRRAVPATVTLTGIDGGTQTLAPFPGQPSSVDQPGSVVGQPASDLHPDVADPDQVLGVVSYGITAVRTLHTEGLVSVATDQQLAAAQGPIPPEVERNDLQLPANEPQLAAIAALARQWAANTGSPYEAARAVEARLRDTQQFQYTLDPPAAPRGTWPIAYFLLQSHRGYCQYYASSMGTMLRTLGIPARLVNGYGPGSAVEASSRGGARQHSVTTSDAHTWVEGFFPGYGWIPFEPTPASVLGDYQPFNRGVTAPPPPPSTTPTPAVPTATPRSRPTVTPSPAATVAVTPVDEHTIPAALAGVVTAVLVVSLLLWVALRWFAHPQSLRAVWRRVAVVGRILGVRRVPEETYRAYAQRIVARIPPDTTTLRHRDGGAPPGPRPVRGRAVDALQLLAELTAKQCYAQGGLDGKERTAWLRAWTRLHRTVPLLAWRRLIRYSDIHVAEQASAADVVRSH